MAADAPAPQGVISYYRMQDDLFFHVDEFHPFIFLPEASFGLRVSSLPTSVCVYVCLSVNHLLVRTITQDPFKLGSPNLDQRCKGPWLRSLLFCGLIDLDLQGQI